MFGSTILDIAIGIIFVYLLLSLMASTINELVLAQLNMRGRFLLRGLRELLNDKDGDKLVQYVYDHGLIFGLFKGDYDPDTELTKLGLIKDFFNPKRKLNLPSYIPSRSFALALMDLIPRFVDDPAANIVPANSKAAAKVTAPNPLVQSTSTPLGGAPTDSTEKSGALNATVPLTAGTGQAGQAKADTLQPFRIAVGKIADPKIREPLIAMIDAANNDATLLRSNIENWFNSTMDRVSGWYKFNSQVNLFLIGLILAIVINTDTIVIARNLSSDSALRQSLVAAASASAKQDKPSEAALADQRQQISNLGLPIGWLEVPPATLPGPGVSIEQARLANSKAASTVEDSRLKPRSILLRDSMSSDTKSDLSLSSFVWFPKAMWLLHVHFLGWLLTALAVSLGAPFWFDTLNKIMVVRSTVKPAEKSGIEKSKS